MYCHVLFHTGLNSANQSSPDLLLKSIFIAVSSKIRILHSAKSGSSILQNPDPPFCKIWILHSAKSGSSILQNPDPPFCKIRILHSAKSGSSILQNLDPPFCKIWILHSAKSGSSILQNLDPSFCKIRILHSAKSGSSILQVNTAFKDKSRPLMLLVVQFFLFHLCSGVYTVYGGYTPLAEISLVYHFFSLNLYL